MSIPLLKQGSILIILTLIVLLSSCTAFSPDATNGYLSVVATTTIVGDVVSQIAGDQITVSVLLPAGTDPHAFEPQPRDIALVADADLIFASGAGLELFLDSMLKNAGGDAQIIDLSQGIEFRTFSTTHLDEHAGDVPEDVNNNVDPHIWHNPLNVIVWVNHISTALIELDPAHAEYYQANADDYIQQLEDLDARIVSQVNQIPQENRFLVMDHETLGYFADRYDFQVVSAVFPGFSTLASPSAMELSELEDQIRSEGVKAIFTGNTVSSALSEQIAQDTGVKLVFIYTDALSKEDQPASTYVRLMEYNARAIFEALK